MAKMPDEIRFGALVYKVLCDDTFSERKLQSGFVKEDDVWGFTDEARSLICILPDASPQQQANTLIHEVLHVIFMSQGMEPLLKALRVREGIEEYIISLVTPTLHAVLVDNPAVIAYIQDPDPSPEGPEQKG